MFDVIPNGFDLLVLRPDRSARDNLRKELAIPADAPLVGMLARFHPMKDHSTFVKAAALLRERLANAHFLLAGEGVDDTNAELIGQLASLGLVACTRLIGVRTDVTRVISSLDLFTLTSCSGEGFPNVLGEAMACEVPCVATRVGDSAYVLGDTGCIVSPRDPQALADAWALILESSNERIRAMGRAARARVEAMFSIGAVATQYIALYEDQVQSEHKRKTSQ
jgi:glycosyltransferase involved in cell wall biosynthesis